MCPSYPRAREFINVLSNIANFSLNGSHGAFMLFHAFKGMKEEFQPDPSGANWPMDGVEVEFSDQNDLKHYQKTINETIQNIYNQRPRSCRFPGVNLDRCCEETRRRDLCCGNSTDITRALNTSLNMMFQSSSGMREDAEQVAVLITDGKDTEQDGVTEEDLEKKYDELAKIFKLRKIKILAIGVGDVSKKNLERLVQSPEHLFLVKSFDGLKENVTKLIGAIICKGTFILLIMTNTRFDHRYDSLCDRKLR